MPTSFCIRAKREAEILAGGLTAFRPLHVPLRGFFAQTGEEWGIEYYTGKRRSGQCASNTAHPKTKPPNRIKHGHTVGWLQNCELRFLFLFCSFFLCGLFCYFLFFLCWHNLTPFRVKDLKNLYAAYSIPCCDEKKNSCQEFRADFFIKIIFSA